jgi:LDH2 family malate/lactate/ureidoglycolate dehydrogenase
VPGSAISPEISDDPEGLDPQGTGHCVVAIHVPSVHDLDGYAKRLDELADAVHGAPRAAGVTAFQIPGDPEQRTAARRGGRIPFDAPSLRLLDELGERFGVPLPSV